MEIGPLSEWVGALAELIAVVVALFLPYFTARQQLKRRLQRFKHIVDQALTAARANQVPAEFEDFRSFVKISLMLETNDTAVSILQIGQSLVTLLDGTEQLTDQQSAEIKGLQAQLALIKA